MNGIMLEVQDRDGVVHTLIAQDGHSNVMQVLFDGGQDIEAVCGGCCSCATCHVYVDPEQLGQFAARSDNELMLLEYSDHFDPTRSRLSCQLGISPAVDGLRLELAPED